MSRQGLEPGVFPQEAIIFSWVQEGRPRTNTVEINLLQAAASSDRIKFPSAQIELGSFVFITQLTYKLTNIPKYEN